MDAVVTETNNLLISSEVLKPGTGTSVEESTSGKHATDNTSECTNAYNYVWLSGDEVYSSDHEDDETNSTGELQQAERESCVEHGNTTKLDELKIEDKKLSPDTLKGTTEDNYAGNSGHMDDNEEMEEEHSDCEFEYNYILLPDKENDDLCKEVADSNNELTAYLSLTNESENVPPVPAEQNSIEVPVEQKSIEVPVEQESTEKASNSKEKSPLKKITDMVKKWWDIAKNAANKTVEVIQKADESRGTEPTRSERADVTVENEQEGNLQITNISSRQGQRRKRHRRKPPKTHRRKLSHVKRTNKHLNNSDGLGKSRDRTKRRHKSKNSDMLMQEAIDFMSKIKLTDTEKRTEGNRLAVLGRSSKRLSEKKKVNYQEMVQGGLSGTSLSSSQSTGQDDRDWQPDWVSDESGEQIPAIFQGCQMKSSLHMKRSRAVPVESKWRKVMPTPTSLRKSANVKHNSEYVNNVATHKTKSQKTKASFNERINSASQSCISSSPEGSLTSEPRIVLEKLDIDSCIRYSSGAEHHVKYSHSRLSPNSSSSEELTVSKSMPVISRPKMLKVCNSHRKLKSFHRRTLQNKQRTDSGRERFPCKYCGLMYSRPYVYMHQRMHRDRNSAKLNNFKVRMSQEWGPEPFEEATEKLKKVTSTVGSREKQAVTMGRAWKQQAGKIAKPRRKRLQCRGVTSHQRVPSPIYSPVSCRPYGCSQCNYKVNNLTDLRNHQLVHQQAGRITCHFCGIVFRHLRALKIWHTKNRIDHSGLVQESFKPCAKPKVRGGVSSRMAETVRCATFQEAGQSSLRIMEGSKAGNDNDNMSADLKTDASNNIYANDKTQVSVDAASKAKILPDANNNTVDACADIDGRVVATATDLTDGVRMDENANIAGSSSKTPISSLSCVSCDFVAPSFEGLGSHFIANHFLSSTPDINNNAESISSTESIAVAGGFAKKYRAKKQKHVYAIINKQLQLGKGDAFTKPAVEEDMIASPGTVGFYSTLGFKSVYGQKGIGEEKNELKCAGKETNTSENFEGKKSEGEGLYQDNSEENAFGYVAKKKRACSFRKYRKDERLDHNNNKAPTPVQLTSHDICPSRRASRNSSNTDVELLTCLVCQSSFPLKADLLKHLTRIHRLTNLCQLCYFREGEIKRFANPVSLRNHKLRLHPEDMVKCMCGAMLIDEKMLTSHLRKFKCDLQREANSGVEMVKCVCGKRFGSTDQLASHKLKCRKRSHSEGSDTSSISGVSYGMPAASGKPVSSPAFNTRSIGTKKSDNAGSSVEGSCSPAKKRLPRERKPSRSPMIDYDSFSNYEFTYEPEVKKKYSEARPVGGNMYDQDTLTYEVKAGKLDDAKTGINKYMKQEQKPSSSKVEHKKGKIENEKKKAKNARNSKQPQKKKKTGQRKKRPDADGRYPCKICRRRFKRPYLYVHQKNAHQRKQWVLVPTGGRKPRKDEDRGTSYRCGWCKFVAVHWRNVVFHHYSKHQEMELDVITMVTKPSEW